LVLLINLAYCRVYIECIGPSGIFSNAPPPQLVEARVLVELKLSPTDPSTARDIYSTAIDKHAQLAVNNQDYKQVHFRYHPLSFLPLIPPLSFALPLLFLSSVPHLLC
jgi:hypothetical protein